jgi:oligopeptide/dipeptide ABC transporter ATP-binding protein
MLRRVKIPSAETLIHQYPYQISGGMRQRVMIAMALVCHPKLVIADEPTTALDVTIQAQILELLEDLQKEFGMSVLIITHDLGIVADLADHVAVMYAGRIVESAPTRQLFSAPRHPYTVGLFQSRPRLGGRKKRLEVIPGVVPNPIDFPPGCRFHPRCAHTAADCKTTDVTLEPVGPDQARRSGPAQGDRTGKTLARIVAASPCGGEAKACFLAGTQRHRMGTVCCWR